MQHNTAVNIFTTTTIMLKITSPRRIGKTEKMLEN